MNPAPFVRLHPDDNIAVAARKVPEGTKFSFDGTGELTVREPIEMGHKIALKALESGQPIKKFGQTIGYASTLIPVGSWVHVHNVSAGELSLDYAFCSQIPKAPTPIEGRTFQSDALRSRRCPQRPTGNGNRRRAGRRCHWRNT